MSTTRYRTTLDRRRAIREKLEDDGWKAVDIERYLEEQLMGEEEIELWVDADELARRIVATASTEGLHGLSGLDTVTTTEYFDFGIEAEIQPPPAADVIDSDEWRRITEERTREQMDAYRTELEQGLAIAGAFEPSEQAAPSCRD